jgi:DNA-binding NarL/FixJ family response regulator
VRSGLTAERVLRDVEVLAHGGLDIGTFLAEVHDSLRRALPSCAACVATVDPETNLLTGTFKFGDLAGRDERDHEWGLVEYGQAEPTSFAELARADVAAAGVHLSTGGDARRSARLRDFITPYFGYADEVRLLARVGGRVWGGAALFRENPRESFNAAEVAFLASLSAPLASGLRAGILARLALSPPPVAAAGPAVIIVDGNNEVSQVSAGAQARLDQLVGSSHTATPTAMIGALVAGARSYAAGLTDAPPRNRVRLPSGQWLVLHASPLSGRDGATGNVVITIEDARPPEIAPLLVAAFDLTPRERDVTQLVLQGVDTKQIAATLHVSAYTIQDHLKSVFDKAGVCNRRELVTRIFFDQYAPRFGGELAPSGWFLGA